MLKVYKEDFKPGMMFEWLEDRHRYHWPEYLVGLYLGSTDYAACLMHREDSVYGEPRMLDVHCENYFRCSPEQWDHGDTNDRWNTSVRQICDSIRESVPELVECGREKVWVAVSLPMDPDYMTRESLDCIPSDFRGVSADVDTGIPEPIAAVEAARYLDPELNMSQGILVIHAGPASVECTALHMGKALVTRRIPIGGDDVAAAALWHVMEVSGVRSQTGTNRSDCGAFREAVRALAQYPAAFRQNTESTLDLRFRLENTVSRRDGKLPTQEEILAELLKAGHPDFDFSGVDRAKCNVSGLLQQIKKTSVFLKISVHYQVDLELKLPFPAGQALWNTVMEEEDIGGQGSWSSQAKALFNRVKNTAEVKNIQCRNLILAGCAAPLIGELAKKSFDNAHIFTEDENGGESRNLIARGLCYAQVHAYEAAGNVIMLQDLLKSDYEKMWYGQREYQDGLQFFNRYFEDFWVPRSLALDVHNFYHNHYRHYGPFFRERLRDNLFFDSIWKNIQCTLAYFDDGKPHSYTAMADHLCDLEQSVDVTSQAAAYSDRQVAFWVNEAALDIYDTKAPVYIPFMPPCCDDPVQCPFPKVTAKVSKTDEIFWVFRTLCFEGYDDVSISALSRGFYKINNLIPPEVCRVLRKKTKEPEFIERYRRFDGNDCYDVPTLMAKSIQFAPEPETLNKSWEVILPRLEAMLGAHLLMVFEDYDDGTEVK